MLLAGLQCFSAALVAVHDASLDVRLVQRISDACGGGTAARQVIFDLKTISAGFQANFELGEPFSLGCKDLFTKTASCEQVFAGLRASPIFQLTVVSYATGQTELRLEQGRIAASVDAGFKQKNKGELTWRASIVALVFLLLLLVVVCFCVDSCQPASAKARSTFRFGLKEQRVDSVEEARVLYDAVFSQSRFSTPNYRFVTACIGQARPQKYLNDALANACENGQLDRFLEGHRLTALRTRSKSFPARTAAAKSPMSSAAARAAAAVCPAGL